MGRATKAIQTTRLDRSDAETPDDHDTTRHDQTAHGGLLPVEETWPLTDEYSTIRCLNLQELSAQLSTIRFLDLQELGA